VVHFRSHCVVALAGATLTLSGCAGNGSSGQDTVWPHAGGELVLQMETVPGMAPPAGAAALPDFSVYGVGTVVVASSGGTAATVADLDDGAVADLLDRAVALVDDGEATGVAGPDAPVTMLTYTRDGARKQATLDGTDADVSRLRQRVLDQVADSGSAPYSPTSVAVIAITGGGGAASAWPLGPLGAGASLDGAFCTVLTGEKSTRALELVTGSPGTAWTSGGRVYAVSVRPLLPDESSCADLE
jgi:hypothetical protein